MGTFESDADARARRRVSRRGEPDIEYMLWVKTQGCLACGKKPTDAHHAVLKSQGGHDQTCIPLCPEHHNLGTDCIHTLTAPAFEDKFGIDITDSLRLLHQQYLLLHPDRTLQPLQRLLHCFRQH